MSAVVGNSGFRKLSKDFSRVITEDFPDRETDWEAIYVKESQGLRQIPEVM